MSNVATLPSRPLREAFDLLNRQVYCTAYSFNTLIAPQYTRAVNAGFKHVETDMSGKADADSHGTSYNLVTSVMYVNPKDNIDMALTKAFMEQVDIKLLGKNTFLSWRVTPQVEFEERRLGGQDFKVYTFKSSFTCR